MNKGIALVCACFLSGCAVSPLENSFSAAEGKSLDGLNQNVFEIRESTQKDFVHFTGADQAAVTTGILFGPIGGMVGVSVAEANAKERGQSILTSYKIPSSSEETKKKLAEKLGMQSITPSKPPLLLDIETSRWGIFVDKVMFHSSIKVFQKEDNAVIAEGECHFEESDDEKVALTDDLFKDDASTLIKKLNLAIDSCVNFYAERLSGSAIKI